MLNDKFKTPPANQNNQAARAKPTSIKKTITYTVYGFSTPAPGLGPSLAFNGERLSLLPAGYFLGNGYRVYSPQLMRFLSSDISSPFGRGGINAYVYCDDDPVNKLDPSGHAPLVFRPFVRFYTWASNKLNKSSRPSRTPASSVSSRYSSSSSISTLSADWAPRLNPRRPPSISSLDSAISGDMLPRPDVPRQYSLSSGYDSTNGDAFQNTVSDQISAHKSIMRLERELRHYQNQFESLPPKSNKYRLIHYL